MFHTYSVIKKYKLYLASQDGSGKCSSSWTIALSNIWCMFSLIESHIITATLAANALWHCCHLHSPAFLHQFHFSLWHTCFSTGICLCLPLVGTYGIYPWSSCSSHTRCHGPLSANKLWRPHGKNAVSASKLLAGHWCCNGGCIFLGMEWNSKLHLFCFIFGSPVAFFGISSHPLM